MAVINTNTKALFSQMALSQTGRLMSKSMEQLSTGKRINTGGDDAAGLAIATRMTQQIRALNQAVRNSGDAISLIQTAEGATNEITDMLQRMRELAIQAVNDTNANADRGYLDLEFQQLKQEIVRVAEMTEWNGFKVLDGTAGERVGEMPVFKTTSVNQFADVFISPTTVRTIGGVDGGEQQVLTFSLVGNSISAGVINISGVDIEIVDEVDNVDIDSFVEKVISTLEQDPYWKPDSGRSIIDEGNGTITFTFSSSDGDVSDIEYSGQGALGLSDDGGPVTARLAVTEVAEAFTGGGAFLKGGALNFEITDAFTATATFTSVDGDVIDLEVDLDGTNGTLTLSGDSSPNANVITSTVVYTLKDSRGAAIDLLSPTDRAVSVSVSVEGGIPTLRAGDLQINGIEIGPSRAEDDQYSPVDNAAGSAIAKAAAINRKAATTGVTVGERQSITFAGVPSPGTITVGGVSVLITQNDNTAIKVADRVATALKNSEQFGGTSGRIVTYAQGGTVITLDYPTTDRNVPEVPVLTGTTGVTAIVDTRQEYSTAVPGTGVFARVNENVLTGQSMNASSSVTGVVFVNGYASAEITTSLNNTRQTRADVVSAINAISSRTGVRAVDTGSDAKGVTLVATDGRNIEVRFETDANQSIFGQKVGLREGVQSSTISLESRIPAPVILTSLTTGDISRVGLSQGNFSANQSTADTVRRTAVEPARAQVMAVNVSGEITSDESFSISINGVTFESVGVADRDKPNEVRNDLIDKINADTSLGVTASEGRSTGEILLVADTPGSAFTLSTSTDTEDGLLRSLTVSANQPAQYKALQAGDLLINGVEIGPSKSSSDSKSPLGILSSSRSASALAIAEAINNHSFETGVRAQANPASTTGLFTDLSSAESGTYSLFLNGVEIEVDLVKDDPGGAAARIAEVVSKINVRTGHHGVIASSNGEGVTLESDGRNLAVWFDSSIKGLTASSFGLGRGGEVAQVSRIAVGSGSPATGDEATIVINGVTITTDALDGMDAGEIATEIARAINEEKNSPNSALANIAATTDGTSVVVSSLTAGSGFEIGGVDVSADSEVDLQVGVISANSRGNTEISGVFEAAVDSDNAVTLYGNVRLISDPALLPRIPSPYGAPPSHQRPMLDASGEPFTISAGEKGFSANGNFMSLGFREGSFGGQASSEMEPPKVGRLAFQVGASAGQLITIDLADFGKNGSITSEITGDVDLNVEDRTSRINTRDGASLVLQKLDDVMERVNATRADMGAIMNRLTHAMDNLTNVSMNQEASRSQIQDADYAKASTELAKSQIMQQAATAVLAQANMSQQTVLQLLQG